MGAPNEPLPRKTLPIFFVLDTSGSMLGDPKATDDKSRPISKLNEAISETIQALRDEAVANADAKLECAILEFNSGAEWVTKYGLEDLTEDFIVPPLEAGGLTDVGEALKQLNSKLSRKNGGFLGGAMGNYMPVIIFMSDGYPTSEWQKPLEDIRKNSWYKHAIKIAFALGDADISVLASLVGSVEGVIKTSDLDLFKRMLRFVTVTASKVGSVSRTPEERPAQKEIQIRFEDEFGDVTPNESELDGETFIPVPLPKGDPDWPDDEIWE